MLVLLAILLSGLGLIFADHRIWWRHMVMGLAAAFVLGFAYDIAGPDNDIPLKNIFAVIKVLIVLGFVTRAYILIQKEPKLPKKPERIYWGFGILVMFATLLWSFYWMGKNLIETPANPFYVAGGCHQPQPETPAPSLSAPMQSDAEIIGWVTNVMPHVIAVNQRDNQNGFAEQRKNFTPQGYCNFLMEQIGKHYEYKRAMNGYVQMSASFDSPPKMINSGIENGIYVWTLTMPMSLFIVPDNKYASDTRWPAQAFKKQLEEKPYTIQADVTVKVSRYISSDHVDTIGISDISANMEKKEK